MLLPADCIRMTQLEPDTSGFVHMLQRLDQANRRTTPAGRLKVGDWVNGYGAQWIVTAIKREHPDDWFNDSVVAVIERPWIERNAYLQKVVWFEDQLMPRTLATGR